jgi:hypothetical protein
MLATILTNNLTVLGKLVIDSRMAERNIAAIALNPTRSMRNRNDLRLIVYHNKTHAGWILRLFLPSLYKLSSRKVQQEHQREGNAPRKKRSRFFTFPYVHRQPIHQGARKTVYHGHS